MRLVEAGVKLSLKKCQFSADRVKFLGNEAYPEKLQAIADLLPPKNVQEVRTFLQMVNQFSKFSDDFADKKTFFTK